jgi:hypothetical protein
VAILEFDARLTQSSATMAAVFKVINDWTLNVVEVRSPEFSTLNATMDNSIMTYWDMNNAQWSSTYSRQYVSGRGDLCLFYDRLAYSIEHPKNQTIHGGYRGEPTGSQNIMRSLTRESTDWTQLPAYTSSVPISAHILQGFSTILPNQSRVQISLHFMIVVAVFNLLKLAAMALVLITDRNAYLVTIGDAAASFLKRPDTITDRKCIFGKEEVFVTMGRLPLHPVSTAAEAKDLDMRCKDTWLPRP